MYAKRHTKSGGKKKIKQVLVMSGTEVENGNNSGAVIITNNIKIVQTNVEKKNSELFMHHRSCS